MVDCPVSLAAVETLEMVEEVLGAITDTIPMAPGLVS